MKEAAGVASSNSNGESSGNYQENQMESSAAASSYDKDDGLNMLDKVAIQDPKNQFGRDLRTFKINEKSVDSTPKEHLMVGASS